MVLPAVLFYVSPYIYIGSTTLNQSWGPFLVCEPPALLNVMFFHIFHILYFFIMCGILILFRISYFDKEAIVLKKEYWQQSPPILKEYIGYMETIKGRSPATVNEYFTDLRTFFRYIKVMKGLVPANTPEREITIEDVDLALIRDITLTDVYEFMNFVREDHENNNKTRARKATSLRMFFRYLTDKTHQLEINPVQNLDTPKLKKSLPKYLTVDQSIELLQSVSGPFRERDYCMLTLLLNCGLRRAELAGINLKDISSERTLLVRGKGNKERVLYLNDACWDSIQSYLKVRPVDGVIDKQALFLSRLKKRISLQGVHLVVKGYLKQVEGAEDMSTHKLRHTAATLMYQQGGVDIRVLQDILGHQNLGTTEIYTHLSSEQVKRAVESNPLAKQHISKKSQS